MTDIEKALAEALEEGGYVGNFQGTTVARDILATEPMQAIARQAAIGAAVERLTNVWPDKYTLQVRHDDRWTHGQTFVNIERVRPGTKQAYDRLRGTGPTLLAALAAALGEDE